MYNNKKGCPVCALAPKAKKTAKKAEKKELPTAKKDDNIATE